MTILVVAMVVPAIGWLLMLVSTLCCCCCSSSSVTALFKRVAVFGKNSEAPKFVGEMTDFHIDRRLSHCQAEDAKIPSPTVNKKP